MKLLIGLLIIFLNPMAFSKPVDAKIWFNAFSADFKKEFCSSKAVLHCYEKISSECFKIADSLAASCFKKIQVPKTVAMGPESGQLGANLGRCIGREVEAKYEKKNIEDKLCQSLF